MNPSLPAPHRVVVIGAGFGGLYVVRGLRRAPVQITVIDRRNHHLFQPLLYQVATAELSPANIASPVREILRGQRNAEVFMTEVTGVDTVKRIVLTSGGEFRYDTLVVATGAQHSYFGHDDWEPFAPGLKKLEDAVLIRAKILTAFEKAEIERDPTLQAAHLTFIIVGAGPTGVELAGSIAEVAHSALSKDFRRIQPKSARILLVEAGPRILPSFDEKLAARAVKDLGRLGVEVMTGQSVEDVNQSGAKIGGKFVPSKCVVWAAGVKASPAGKWLQAETDKAGRVKVGADLNSPLHPEIFVIGDTAAVSGPDGKPLPGVAPVAIQQGQYVARRIRDRLRGRTDFKPFHYFNKGSLATIGRSSAIADFGKLKLTGFMAWVLWGCVHILYLIGFRNRVLVIIEWMWAYLTFKRGARLITQEPRND